MTPYEANHYFETLPEGFAPAEELRAALPAAVQQVQFVGVAGTAGKTATAGLLGAILQAAGFVTGLYHAGCEPLAARIRVQGAPVDEVLFREAAEKLSAAKPLPRAAAELGAAGCRSGSGSARHAGLRGNGHRPGRHQPLCGALGRAGCRCHAGGFYLRHRAGAAQSSPQ